MSRARVIPQSVRLGRNPITRPGHAMEATGQADPAPEAFPLVQDAPPARGLSSPPMVPCESSSGEEGAGHLLCDRRAVLAASCCGALALAAPAAAARTAGEGRARKAHLSFFDDRPLLDRSGKMPAYRPPAGFHGASPLADMAEERLRYIMPFMT